MMAVRLASLSGAALGWCIACGHPDPNAPQFAQPAPVALAPARPSEPTPTACLQYEPKIVVLRGEIVRATFPGPPNYESIELGDARETYWLLRLQRPICVEAASDYFDQAHAGVAELQLVFLNEPHPYETYRDLMGHVVEVNGELFGAQTGHHHTDVLLSVKGLHASSDRSR